MKKRIPLTLGLTVILAMVAGALYLMNVEIPAPKQAIVTPVDSANYL